MKIAKLLLFISILMTVPAAAALAQNDDQKRHPSYNLMGRDAVQNPTSPLNPNFVEAPEARLSESGFWRSSYINESLVGLVVDDIDRDGQNEVIYAGAHTIYVTRHAGGKLQQLASYSVRTTDTILSLDALDVDNDGRLEIICSVQNDKRSASSLILSFNGSTITPLAENISWYLRVVGPKGSQFLAGQKPGSTPKSFYSGNVMRMAYSGGKVSSQGQVGLPPFINVFNFTMGRLGSGGIQMIAAIKFPSEHIFLFEGRNQAWESKEEYGGTMNYMDPIAGSDSDAREYLPARMLLADIDGDGQNELIVAKNDRGGVAFMSKLRAFSGGAMQAFKYGNMSLTPFFRTRSLPGPGVDYALADFNNNGTIDLVVAVVTEQKSGMMKEGRSVIIAYELTPANNQ